MSWTWRVCIFDVWIIGCRHRVIVIFPRPSWPEFTFPGYRINLLLNIYFLVQNSSRVFVLYVIVILFHFEKVDYLHVNKLAGCQTANTLYRRSCLPVSRMSNSQHTLPPVPITLANKHEALLTFNTSASCAASHSQYQTAVRCYLLLKLFAKQQTVDLLLDA